mmetsp:Transcript_35146/g.82763  ORF Transcript_35146/g.82763 Transcript_35146/m.82763 type:complete len:260 (-) Transcript_35146:76-855(-)
MQRLGRSGDYAVSDRNHHCGGECALGLSERVQPEVEVQLARRVGQAVRVHQRRRDRLRPLRNAWGGAGGGADAAADGQVRGCDAGDAQHELCAAAALQHAARPAQPDQPDHHARPTVVPGRVPDGGRRHDRPRERALHAADRRARGQRPAAHHGPAGRVHPRLPDEHAVRHGVLQVRARRRGGGARGLLFRAVLAPRGVIRGGAHQRTRDRGRRCGRAVLFRAPPCLQLRPVPRALLRLRQSRPQHPGPDRDHRPQHAR